MKKRMLAFCAAVCCLLAGCGAEPSHKSSDTAVSEQTKFTTEAVQETSVETKAETEKMTETSELTGYLWEKYDCALEYPAQYVLEPEKQDTKAIGDIGIEDDVATASYSFAPRQDNGSSVILLVAEDSMRNAAFDAVQPRELSMHMGIDDPLLLTGKTLDEVTLPHCSGMQVRARKLTTECAVGDVPGQLSILLVNNFTADQFYMLVMVNTEDAYREYCALPEEHFYLGNCSLEQDKVQQTMLPVSSEPQTLEMAELGTTLTLPAEWRQIEDAEKEYEIQSGEYEGFYAFETADGDSLMLSFSEGTTDEIFTASFEQQKGSLYGSGAVPGSEKKCTVDGYTAYYMQVQHIMEYSMTDSGVSGGGAYTSDVWLINRTGAHPNIVTVSMSHFGDEQSDFAAHLEEYLTL